MCIRDSFYKQRWKLPLAASALSSWGLGPSSRTSGLLRGQGDGVEGRVEGDVEPLAPTASVGLALGQSGVDA
eukprot:6857880-Alexandrium_andersonii.AAC.1